MLDEVVEAAVEQERLEAWIMQEVDAICDEIVIVAEPDAVEGEP